MITATKNHKGKGQVWVGTAGTEGHLAPAVKSPAALGQPSHSLGLWVSTPLNSDQSSTWYFRSLGSMCVTH